MFARSVRKRYFPHFYLCNCVSGFLGALSKHDGKKTKIKMKLVVMCACASIALLLQGYYQICGKSQPQHCGSALMLQYWSLCTAQSANSPLCTQVYVYSSFIFICRLTGRERRNVLSHFLENVLVSMLSLMIHSCLIVREVSQETVPATLVHPVPHQSRHLSHRYTCIWCSLVTEYKCTELRKN